MVPLKHIGVVLLATLALSMIALASVFNSNDAAAGSEIDIRVENDVLQWQYKGSESWSNLFDLTTLEGEAGAQGAQGLPGSEGIQGVPGADGREVTFRVTDDAIEWQYVGETAWQSLIALNLLRVTEEATSTPIIGANGNWFINGVDSGVPAQGPIGVRGSRGFDGAQGPKGPQGIQGEQGPQGTPGALGATGVGITSIDFETRESKVLMDCNEIFMYWPSCIEDLDNEFNYVHGMEYIPKSNLDNEIFVSQIGFNVEEYLNTQLYLNQSSFNISVQIRNDVYSEDHTFNVDFTELTFELVDEDNPDYQKVVIANLESDAGSYLIIDLYRDYYQGQIDFIELKFTFSEVDLEEIFIQFYLEETSEFLVFALSDDSEYELNYTELVQEGYSYQSFIQDLEALGVEVEVLRDFIESLQLEIFMNTVSRAERLADLIMTNSIFGFDPYRWDSNDFSDSSSIIRNLSNSVSTSTLYDRNASLTIYERLVFEVLVANLLYAMYYELSEEDSSFTVPTTLKVLLNSTHYDYIINSFSSDDYGDLLMIIGHLTGLSNLNDLNQANQLLTSLEHRQQNAFFQYIMTNPLTGWEMDNINHLREFISMSTRGILNTTIVLNLDPEGFGIEFGSDQPTGNVNGARRPYFSSDWRAGGPFGISTYQKYDSAIDTINWSNNFYLSSADGSGVDLQLYFGTTSIIPNTYPSSNTSVTAYTFTVNYGQVFPLPTEVNFKGLLIGANIITQAGLTTDNPRPVMINVTDSGINHLDYVVYGTSNRTFRLNNFFIDEYAPNNVPNCVNEPNSNTGILRDDIIGIPHGGQNYFKFACTRESGENTVTDFTNTVVAEPKDLINLGQYRTGNPSVFHHHTYEWPVERQYITFNRLYSDPYMDGATSPINISAHWVEVFKVEFVVEGEVIRTEFVDKDGNALGLSITDASILAMLDSAGLEFVPGDEKWVIDGSSTIWTPGAIITTNTVINAETIRPIVYDITYENLDLPFVGLVTAPALTNFTAGALSVTLSSPAAVEGFEFLGWVTDSTITNVAMDSVNYDFITQITEVGNVTLYAVFAPTVYTITVNYSDGSEPTIPETYTIFDSIDLPSPSKTGHEFDGWIGTNVSNDDIPEGSTGNITITANFTIKQYTFSFNTDGGTPITDITEDFGTSVTAPSDPTRAGFNFDRWDAEIPNTMPDKDLNFTALWIPILYNIQIDVDGPGNFGFSGTRNVGETITITVDDSVFITEIKIVNLTDDSVTTLAHGVNTFEMPASNIRVEIKTLPEEPPLIQ